MRILVFTHSYPVPYKPYYDTQFVDLLRQGHELTIFAAEQLDSTVNEKVVRYGLQERTRRYPTTLHTIAGRLPDIAVSVLRHPSALLRDARVVSRGPTSIRRRITNVARMLSIRSEQPELCLIHGLGTAILFSWIRRVLPAEVPVAMYYHGGEVPGVARWRDEDTHAAFEAMDVVFTNTEFSAQGAVERGCPREKLVILPVGFALEDFQPPAHREYRPQGTLRLVSVSRLSEGKGHVYALEALARMRAAGLDDFQYTIVGDGPSRPTLEACVREHGLTEHVVFTGTMANTEVIPALARADALILASHETPNWTETQGAILHEAMLMRTLVVTTTTGGVPESIPREMKAYAAEPADVGTLRDALERIYRLSDSQMRRLGQSVRAWTEANYDVRVLNDRILGEIHERKAAAGRPAANLCLQGEAK